MSRASLIDDMMGAVRKSATEAMSHMMRPRARVVSPAAAMKAIPTVIPTPHVPHADIPRAMMDENWHITGVCPRGAAYNVKDLFAGRAIMNDMTRTGISPQAVANRAVSRY